MADRQSARVTAFERFRGPETPDAAESPRVNPLAYPGVWPETSVLLTDDDVVRLRLEPHRRLGQGVVFTGRDVPSWAEWPTADRWGLSYVLQRLNRARVDVRYPVLAVGSNASPAQLWHKFHEHDVSPVMPMVVADVRGAMAGVAAAVAPYGSVPATPVIGPDLHDTLFVQWVDDQQLAALDATEVGYTRVLLTPGGSSAPEVTVTLRESGEVLGGCYAYVSTSGHLKDENGEPMRLADYADQPDLITRLLGRSADLRGRVGATLNGWLRSVGAPGAGAAVLDIFRRSDWVGADTLVDSLADVRDAPAVPYRDLLPLDLHGDLDAEGHPVLTCIPSSDDIERRGQSVVRLPEGRWADLARADRTGQPQHVAIRPLVHRARASTAGLEAMARCLPGPPDLPDDRIEIDETLRAALGLEIGEQVAYRAVSTTTRHPVVDWALGESNHLVCRVQAAEFTIAERNICLLSPLALELLGVESGDEVVIEGRAPEGGTEVAIARIKAFAVSQEIQESREALHGGDFGNRYPRAQDALGIAIDVAWIYLDQAVRARLGLGSQALAVVRVRPSRRQQFRKELREMLLVLAIALVALVEVVPGGALKAGVVLVTGLAALVAIVFRMRRRLSHSPQTMWSQVDDLLATPFRRLRRRGRGGRGGGAGPGADGVGRSGAAPGGGHEEARAGDDRPGLPRQRGADSVGPGHGPGSDHQAADGDDHRGESAVPHG